MSQIILADDHALMRQALETLLTKHGHQIIAQAQDFDQLKTKLTNTQADIIICDCKMPGSGAVNFLCHLKQQNIKLKVLFLTALQSGVLFNQLISLGVNGLVSKKADIEDVLQAIEQIEQQVYLSEPIKQAVASSPQQLTNKEFQVFELIVKGLNNNQIAEQLHRSASTVNTHRVSLMQKLDIHNVVELIHFAHKNGLFSE